MVEWLAGNRIKGTSTERTTKTVSTPPTVSTDGDYTVLTYTQDGAFVPKNSFNVDYLVVAGGGGGGSGGAGGSGAGGGGAGGYRTATGFEVTKTLYNITVGAAGSGATTTNTVYSSLGANAKGSNGGDSAFGSITSIGGGGGAAGTNVSPYGVGGSGGSGGGDAFYLGSGSGISGQGNDGGDSPTSGGSTGDWNGGGGGGAGAAGAGGSASGGGAGGSGLQSSINGTATYYAGGGGGGVWQDTSITGGAGGSSIGGAGGNYNSAGSDATGYGSGGGGGGVWYTGSDPSYAGGNGSQGIVILRFLTSGNEYSTTADIFQPTLQSPSVAGWKELGRKKLGSSADTIDVSNIDNKKYLMFIVQSIPSGNTNLGLRFNGETGSRYSQNGSYNTANDSSGSSTSTSCIGNYGSAITTPALHIGYVVNETNKIKLIRSNSVIQKDISDVLDVQESWGTFAPSTITEVIEDLSWINTDSGSFDTDSELIVLGWDPADTHTDNFWEELATITETEGTSETFNTPVFTSKKYIMFEAYIIDQNNSDAGIDMYVNDTTGSGTYRMRYDNNFAKQGYDGGTGTGSYQLLYGNGFVNNENFYMRGFGLNISGKQKLFMADVVTDGGSNTGTPNARVLGGKTVATNYDITQIGFRNRGTTTGKNIGIGSVIKVWGHD